MGKHGGKRKGAGRKPKGDEHKLIENMDAVMSEEEVVKLLSKLAKDGNMKALDLWMAYRYGKPNQSIDHTTNGSNIELPPLKFNDE